MEFLREGCWGCPGGAVCGSDGGWTSVLPDFVVDAKSKVQNDKLIDQLILQYPRSKGV